MLTRFYTNILVEGVLIFGFFAAILYTKAYDLMTLSTIYAFISQISLLLYYSEHQELTSSSKFLFFTVLVYSLILGIIFMLVSDYYSGDTFLFNKNDALKYYTESMKAIDLGFYEGVNYLMGRHDFEDLGAFFFDTFLMSIIRDKFFANFIYIILGSFAAVFLFNIARNYMPDEYAFLASLSYGTSSYMIFFYCSFLKEAVFVFLVIAGMYNAYQYIKRNSGWSLFTGILCIGLILFFRPAVAALEVAAILTYYGIKIRGKASSLFLYFLVAAALAISFNKLEEMSNRYTSGGDIDFLIEYSRQDAYSGGFTYFVAFFSAFLGPFPTLFTKIEMNPSSIQFYGAGLTYKLFLVIPLWIGIYIAVKKWIIEMFPLIAFCLLEMLATAYICDSLELRKVLLHVPFTYILAFYGLSHLTKDSRFSRLSLAVTYIFPIGVLTLWNLVRM